MHCVAVFAGLGSESLFSRSTLDTAVQDATLPESQIILRACHIAFRTQVAKAVERGRLPAEVINLDDFMQPETLLRPPPSYHQNVIVQHTTIYLVQILRYLRQCRELSDIRSVAGFCAGLLPAAAVATAGNVIEFLQRAQDFFNVALLLGINSEIYRNSQISQSGCSPSLPWSVVVHNISSDVVAGLKGANGGNNPHVPVYITAQNSATCVTLSGRGDQLAQFIQEKLPSQCRTRSTNVFTLYHNRDRLTDVFQETIDALERVMPSQLEVPLHLVAPLYSTISGTPVHLSNKTNTPATLGQLISLVLEMILLEPVDWVSVQDSILAELRQHDDSELCEVLNFGPGYGISKPAQPMPQNVEIRDVSATGASRKPISEASSISLDDVAIVGMAVEMPDAQDINELWENLWNGVDSCKEIPTSRFHVDDFFHKKDEHGNKSKRSLNTRYGNFLKNPFLFDNDLFDISPREARSIDPQQRVLLQTAYRALEDAGYVPDSTASFSRDTFGCYIGNATNDYVENLRAEIDVYYSPGTLRAFQSGRISYYFGWSGPSVTLDTACSSSMFALHQAARALAAGDCRAALVGGVNVISSPDMYLGLDRAHFLSPTGQCKAFDASADGYCRSEGCGIFVVKKLRDALAEGDRIHGVIKGIEVNQSGNAHSITHPHAPTQEQLFKRLFNNTKINPHQITVVETHGTGTQAGDPNELESLRNGLCSGRDSRNPVHFTSIKANIGHCEAASGAAALAKVVLMMRHEQIPPQISLKTLNPKIQNLGVDGAVIDRNGVPWHQPGDQPRLALINNFGAAGSNVAMILQQYNSAPLQKTTRSEDLQTYILGISGKSAKVLLKLRDEVVARLRGTLLAGSSSLADICYTMTARRQLYDFRLSVTADSVDKLIRNLESAEPNRCPADKGAGIRVVFVFSGQGSQYLGMGQELMSIYPVFSETIRQCDQILRKNGFPGCLEIINANGTDDPNPDSISQLQALQSAIFALEVALAQLLISWNILPSAVIGHSLGEYAALVAAGVLDISSGALLVARRAQLMATNCELEKTSMLAVNLGASDVQTMVQGDDRFKKLAISCDNSRTDCVVGGPVSQLQTFKNHLASVSKVKSKLLEVPLAYHTQAMDPILPELTQYASTMVLRKPSLPVISNVLGRTVQPGENVFTPEYFARHSRQTVSFQQGVDDFLTTSPDSAATHWVEVGPHASLLPMIATQAPTPQAGLLPSLRKGISPSSTLSQLLGHFYQKAAPVDWRQAFAFHDRPNLVDLPGLPFFQSEFVASYPHETSQLLTGRAENAITPTSNDVFLGRTVQKACDANGFSGIYETLIQSLKDLITGHIVCEHALCPASVYHQMALSAVADMESESTADLSWSLANISYVAPLLYTGQSTAVVRINITPLGSARNELKFEVSSFAEGTDPNRSSVHCKGRLKRKARKSTEQKYTRIARMLERQTHRFMYPESSTILETFSTKAMYDNVFTRVVTYSKLYQQVQFIRISPDCGEAYARCKYPETLSTPAKANAIFMDVLLHVAGFVANLSIAGGEAGICKEVASALVLRESVTPGALFDVYCTLITIPAEGVIIADAQAADEHGLMAIFKGMVFQQVQLAKVSQAFSIASKRGQGPLNTSKTSTAPCSQQKSATSLQVKVSETPSATTVSASSTSTVRNLVSQTCGVDIASLSMESNLEELGFDSLLMIELEAQLSPTYPQLDLSDLAECATVGDIERLCAGEEELDTPPSPGNQTPSEGSPIDVGDGMQYHIREIIAETCSGDMDSITSSSELSALGIDSLMFFELESSLSKISKNGYLSPTELSECRTVGDVEKLILGNHQEPPLQDDNSSVSSGSSVRSLVTTGFTSPMAVPTPINTTSAAEHILLSSATIEKISHMLNLDQQPETVQTAPEHGGSRSASLFLIHDGSGICTHYHRLGSLNRPVYALHDSKLLDPFDTWANLGEMADEYAREIASTTTGPYLLGGWSFGGVVAFEAARRLAAQGKAVIGTILIDSPPPLNHQPLSPRILDAVTGAGKASGNETSKAIRSLTRRNFAACASLLGAFRPSAPDALPVPRVFLLRSRLGWRDPANPQFVENRWLQDRSDLHTAIAGWETVAQAHVSSIDIPGDHFRVFDPANLDAVADAIRRAASELEVAYAGV